MGSLVAKVAGALYGQAIGDAMGAPVEGWPPARIAARFSEKDFRRFLPVTHGGDPSAGKGDGRVTDDTLMVEALIRAYARRRGHMDAYDFEKYLLPEMAETIVWLPERQCDMPILDRLFWPDRFAWIRLAVNHAEPRSAGVGNMVSCGVAKYMMPVGAVNAGDPVGAYQEAAALGLAENESYALEAAAVTAASFAAAFGSSASASDIVAVALELARDGTSAAIAAACQAANAADALPAFVNNVRTAVAPYDPRTGHVSDDAPLKAVGVSDVGRPSRLRAIEELPVALAALQYGNGDWAKTLRASVCYGRDCDTIAGIACGLFGALSGEEGIPRTWRDGVDAANRRNYRAQACQLAEVARAILKQDQVRLESRLKAASL